MRTTLLIHLITLFLMTFTLSSYANNLSGKWQAGSLRVSWAIGDWGKACGPRPHGGGEKGGLVTLTESGAGFRLQGLGRSYSSLQCWEQMPGLKALGQKAGSSAITTTCRMPVGDPRQARVTTAWYPRGDKIYFDESGQYQFVVLGSNCTASVRRTRVLTRVITQSPEPKPTLKTEPINKKKVAAFSPQKAEQAESPLIITPTPPPLPARASRCDHPGPPLSLEVTPQSKLMKAGEVFSFQAIARDGEGCRVPISTTWTITEGAATISRRGALHVPTESPRGLIKLQAQVASHKIEVQARVVSAEEYEQLLAGQKYGVLGESFETSTIALAMDSVELGAQFESEPAKKNQWTLTIVGSFVLLLGAFSIVLLKRRTPHKATSAQNESKNVVPVEDEINIRAQECVQTIRLCPLCGKSYEDGTLFCVEDGSRLVRANR